jgi:hypothetical protein
MSRRCRQVAVTYTLDQFAKRTAVRRSEEHREELGTCAI